MFMKDNFKKNLSAIKVRAFPPSWHPSLPQKWVIFWIYAKLDGSACYSISLFIQKQPKIGNTQKLLKILSCEGKIWMVFLLQVGNKIWVRINVIKKSMRSKANHWVLHLVSEVTIKGTHRQLFRVGWAGKVVNTLHTPTPMGPAS